MVNTAVGQCSSGGLWQSRAGEGGQHAGGGLVRKVMSKPSLDELDLFSATD